MKDLDYKGIDDFSRERKLSEYIPQSILEDGTPNVVELPDDISKRLFTNIAKTYLKGQVVKKGLSLMEEAQFIPIPEDNGEVSSAAFRLNKKLSENGKKIPFTMYQKCVDILADRQWEARRVYDSFINPDNIPKDSKSSSKAASRTVYGGSDITDYIRDYYEGDGVAGMILTALTLAPFQNLGFQALGVEQGTKAYFSAQVPIGIAILLELGIKAYRIIQLLKDANLHSNDLEATVNKLENSEEARRSTFSDVGIDYDAFKESHKVKDSRIILDYCGQYIASYQPKSTETYDHWTAYGNVVCTQNLLRGALDTATEYSKEFSELTQTNLPNTNTVGGIVSDEINRRPQIKINNIIGSYYNELERSSDLKYQNIVNSFMYQVADEDICCLVEIFGSLDPEILTVTSQILKILSLDLQGEIVRLQDIFFGILSDISTAAIFKIVTELTKLSDKVGKKIFYSLDESLPSLQHCPSIKDVAISLGIALDNITQKINEFLVKILDYTDKLSSPSPIGWTITADRRYLLTIARVLEVLASKLKAAEVCDRKNLSGKQYDVLLQDAKDQASVEIIHTIIDRSPPSIQITDSELKRYFPDLEPSVSKTFGFSYGPKTIFPHLSRNSSKEQGGCSGRTLTEEHVEELKSTLLQNIKKAFEDNG